MYRSDSDTCLKDSCYCCLKTAEKPSIKEISNPLPLDFIVFQTPEPISARTIPKRLPKTEDSQLMDLSTFPRMKKSIERNVFTDNNNDIFQSLRSDAVYQEIVDDTPGNVRKFNTIQNPNFNAEVKPKKYLNISFVNSRIIIGYETSEKGADYAQTIMSLKNVYGKCLKKFVFAVKSDIGCADDENLSNTLSTLPYLMPLLDETLKTLSAISDWLIRSRKNIIFLVCQENSMHIVAACVRYVLVTDETNRRLMKFKSVILMEHEWNAVSFFEKMNLEKFHCASLKRSVQTVSNIMLGLLDQQPNLKNIHCIVIKSSQKQSCPPNVVASAVEKDNDGCPSYVHHSHPNCKLQSIFLTIYQNFHLVHTTYKINVHEWLGVDQIVYVIDPILPIKGDVLIMANGTNAFGFQTIYFRLQFNTCWIKGDFISFKNAELDNSYTSCQFQKTSYFEIYFSNQPEQRKEHELSVLNSKYSVCSQRTHVPKDINVQLKLLEHCVKSKDILSYTAGPVDGNLYAAINKPQRSRKNYSEPETKTVRSLKSSNARHRNLLSKADNTSLIKKFEKLESQIATAADLISTSDRTTEKAKCENGKLNVLQNKDESSIRTSKSFPKLSTFQNHFNPNSNDCNRKSEERHYFLSLTNRRDPSKEVLPLENVNYQHRDREIAMESSSPYDNINRDKRSFLTVPERIYSDRYKDVLDVHHLRMYEDTFPYGQQKDPLLYDNCPPNCSSSSFSDVVSTRHLWFKQNFSRRDAILYLLNKPIGSFVVRQSTSLSKSLSIAIKCVTSIFCKSSDNDNDSIDHIKHFIIDIYPDGYRIRGFQNERIYHSLFVLIQEHLENKLSFPCLLVLPSSTSDYDSDQPELYGCQTSTKDQPYLISDFNVLYLGSYVLKHPVDVSVITVSVDKLQERIEKMPKDYQTNSLTKMTLKMCADRIILTDVGRKVFFRKHCKLTDIIFCEIDPKRRVWNDLSSDVSKVVTQSCRQIFGIVSCLNSNSQCSNQIYSQLFCSIDKDAEQFCTAVNVAIKNL